MEENNNLQGNVSRKGALSSGLMGSLVLSVLLTIGVAVFATFFVPDYLRREWQSDLAQNGELASARILSVSETGRWYAKKPILQFSVQVVPANSPEFTAQFDQEVPLVQAGQFHAGVIVQVRFDPAKANEVIIVNQSSP